MHTFSALALCASLACLAGCLSEATEAIEQNAVTSPQLPFAGDEIFRMFSEEKTRASASELPDQF